VPGLPETLLQLFLSVEFARASLRFSTPLIGAATGEILSEQAGVVNIGLEGMMLTGAFAGVLGSYLTGSVWGGVGVALLAGGLVGFFHAIICVILGANQVVSGAAINLGALGLTTFLNRAIFGQSPPAVRSFESFPIPILSQIPVIGPMLFDHIPLVYLIYLLVPLMAILLFRTQWGLRLRAIGEKPEAAESAGVPVIRTKIIAVVSCGMLAGLAGTFYSLGNVRFFTENMTAGNGYIALAVVIVANWRPQWTIPAALLFGAANALALRAQAFQAPIPYQLLFMLPYVLTLLVYAGLIGRSRMPAALGKLFLKD
jgi:ABC-type uncharacterized transport system permease subunit